MKIMIMALVVTLVVTAKVEAYENIDFFSADTILGHCESEKNLEQNYCAMYLAGVLAGVSGWTELREIRGDICPPEGVSLIQLKKVFAKRANDFPEDLHLSASSIAIHAFHGAFPCE